MDPIDVPIAELGHALRPATDHECFPLDYGKRLPLIGTGSPADESKDR